eukprot:COSAG06_NODE_2808_length_6249_cov_12.456585_6_plen_67_part_00
MVLVACTFLAPLAFLLAALLALVVRKTPFIIYLIIIYIIVTNDRFTKTGSKIQLISLPRQARDNHH